MPDPRGARLDSWKEIAAYLGREVRTVQRWEKTEGLPVHRHDHDERSSVYVYVAELDAWREARDRRAPADQLASPGPGGGLWMAAAGLATVGAVAAVAAALWLRPSSPGLEFAARDWVLVGRFDNRTGDTQLDGTIEAALSRELSSSRFVNVAPPERVQDTLRLMREPLDASLDRERAIEVARRDGGIRAVLVGDATRVGDAFLVAADIVDPETGTAVASISADASSTGALAAAIRRLSDGVRARLGESFVAIGQSGEELAKVTTPSLQALRLYSQADAEIPRRKNAIAEQLLREAIEEDPGFASAYIHLAWAIRNQGRPPEEYRPFAARGYALVDTASEPERYFIVASYHDLFDRSDEAAATYESLLSLYPDHFWALRNVTAIYVAQRRTFELSQLYQRLASVRPYDLNTHRMAVQSLLRLGELVDARPFVDRARMLIASEAESPPGFRVTLELFPIWDAWMAGEIERGIDLLRAIPASGPGVPSDYSGDFRRMAVGTTYLSFGLLEEAAPWFERITTMEELRLGGLAQIAWLRGDPGPQARLRAEMVNQESVADSPSASEFRRAQRARRSALEAIDAGHPAEATSALTQTGIDPGNVIWLAERLSPAWQRAGEPERALRLLERASTRPLFPSSIPLNDASWFYLELDRARLTRELRGDEEADRIEARLRRLLAYADEDHVIKQALESTRPANALVAPTRAPAEARP